jgi:hypothetical protein
MNKRKPLTLCVRGGDSERALASLSFSFQYTTMNADRGGVPHLADVNLRTQGTQNDDFRLFQRRSLPSTAGFRGLKKELCPPLTLILYTNQSSCQGLILDNKKPQTINVVWGVGGLALANSRFCHPPPLGFNG